MTVRYHVDQGVATLELARPEKKNALTLAMYSALADHLEAAAGDESVRAILITGQPGIFTAGNDLHDFLQSAGLTPDSPPIRFMLALARAEKPVVAAVTGAAVGIGVTLLLHCDLVYLADDSRLTMPFVSLGLVPEFASSLLVPLWAGHARASEKILLGLPFSAQEALAMGLASAVLPAAEVLGHARAMAARFNALPPGAVRESKRLLKRAQARQVEETILEEARSFSTRLGGAEVREAVAAFFEKRAPDFSRAR
ncbi:MAG: enoyl-CoA hydratase [Steroidobacteraceae bacterium]|jgi:enoyl-CoA hydratase/carnithine racemase|nr:enoyl-CoA hydratase [Steroidobacteraceae bacterium]